AQTRTTLPEYVTGDECLFCHRNDIGPGWSRNRHNLTLRQHGEGYMLGTRELRRAGYGRLAIRQGDTWNPAHFADRCAGCHTTAVDARTRAFASPGLDCYTCHGAVDLDHTQDTSRVWLSKKRRDDAKAITSICAQCHLRGGKSRSTGLPYAANFVAGDDLFADYEADLAKAGDAALNPGDRHVYRNVRDALTAGSDVTCLGCHRVHAPSGLRHRRAAPSAICNDCHAPTGPRKNVIKYTVRSAVCEY
ncbi:MAG: hypothetical protein ACRD96_16270, partial [Bryobacteraceae bacterium]